MQLIITDIQQGCTHDGPGLRTTVFFKGCPLHCLWCHNPETQKAGQELFFRPEQCIGCGTCLQVCPQGVHVDHNGQHCIRRELCKTCTVCAQQCPAGALEAAGKTVTLSYVMERVLEDRIFYRDNGGLTVSGGEPTMQKQALLTLLEQAKKEGIHICLETCGVFPASLREPLSRLVDLFLYDIKDTDSQRLLENTGADYRQVEENLLALDAMGASSVLRCLLIPGINMEKAHAQKLIDLFGRLQNCQGIELLPYHPYGLSKSAQLGRQDREFPQPAPEEMERFAAILKTHAVPVKLYGSFL